jgi:hypothetical protein
MMKNFFQKLYEKMKVQKNGMKDYCLFECLELSWYNKHGYLCVTA